MQTGASILRCHSSDTLVLFLLSLVCIFSYFILGSSMRTYRSAKRGTRRQPCDNAYHQILTPDSRAPADPSKEVYQVHLAAFHCTRKKKPLFDSHEKNISFRVSDRVVLQPEKKKEELHRNFQQKRLRRKLNHLGRIIAHEFYSLNIYLYIIIPHKLYSLNIYLFYIQFRR